MDGHPYFDFNTAPSQIELEDAPVTAPALLIDTTPEPYNAAEIIVEVEAAAKAKAAAMMRPQPIDDASEHDRTSPDNDAVLMFLSPAECAELTMMGSDYVLKFMLDRGQVGCIFGAPGAGKSLIAPYIAYRLALGLRPFGCRTRPGGKLVFYCAAEDEIGMRRRIAALRTKHGDTDKFVLIGGVTDLANEKGARRQALMQAIAERKPELVVIDTLAVSFAGIDENDGRQMAWVVFTAKQMIAAGAGSILFVHHDPKSGGHTPRGHGVFNGELDVTVRLDKGCAWTRATMGLSGAGC
jgi:hypothetical protein